MYMHVLELESESDMGERRIQYILLSARIGEKRGGGEQGESGRKGVRGREGE